MAHHRKTFEESHDKIAREFYRMGRAKNFLEEHVQKKIF